MVKSRAADYTNFTQTCLSSLNEGLAKMFAQFEANDASTHLWMSELPLEMSSGKAPNRSVRRYLVGK